MNLHKTDNAFLALRKSIEQLTGESGCPWDKKQTNESIIKYLKSETQELIKGLEKKDYQNICEELGDVLFIVMLISSYNQRQERFDFNDVLVQLNEKLIRRHPHVFADTPCGTEEELDQQWQRIKDEEKKAAKKAQNHKKIDRDQV